MREELGKNLNYDLQTLDFDENGIKNFYSPIKIDETDNFRNQLINTLCEFHETRVDLEEQSFLRIFSKWLLITPIQIYEWSLYLSKFSDEELSKINLPKQFKIANHLLNKFDRPFMGFQKLSIDGLLKYYLKKLIRTYQWNNSSPKEVVKACNITGLTKKNAHEKSVYLEYIQLEQYFKGSRHIGTHLGDDFKSELHIVLKSMFSEPIFNKDKVFKLLEIFVEECFRCFDENFNFLMARPLPKKLWIGCAGSTIWHRLFCEAIRRNGGRVTAHDHGGGNAYMDQLQMHYVEYQLCDEFVTYNDYQKEKRASKIEGVHLYGNNKVEISSILSNPRETKDLNLKKEIKKIMYVPTALHGEGVRLRPIMHDWVYFDWQIRLIKFIKDQGIDVILKPHPEGRSHIPKDFAKKLGVEVYFDRFENLNVEYDAYLIDFITSSTTPRILKSSDPICFINPGFPRLYEDSIETLKGRCHYIQGFFDKDNRFDIEWSELKGFLNRKEFHFNNDFPRKYFTNA